VLIEGDRKAALAQLPHGGQKIAGENDFVHRGISFEQRGARRLEEHAEAQVRPPVMQGSKRRSGEDDVAKRTQAYDQDLRPGRQIREERSWATQIQCVLRPPA
jgi:hypothetical protein